ncbi:hypothetical protein [Planctomicrobium sp. SH527]|uniref:hypothetical protein n=1 Tax=Planctomicrobium sp. SH527 TaxID=3448123 RepID=UPI003F5BD04F
MVSPLKMPLSRTIFLLASILLGSGCGAFSPSKMQYPDFAMRHPEAQRRAAQVQDPYPDASVGPQMNFRPLGFQNQRSSAQQVKDRYYSSFLRSNFGNQPQTSVPQPGAPVTTGMPPMMGPQMAKLPKNSQYVYQPQPATMQAGIIQPGVMQVGAIPVGAMPAGTIQTGQMPAGAMPIYASAPSGTSQMVPVQQGTIQPTVVYPGALHPGLMQVPPGAVQGYPAPAVASPYSGAVPPVSAAPGFYR